MANEEKIEEITPVEGVHFNAPFSPPTNEPITSESLTTTPTIDFQEPEPEVIPTVEPPQLTATKGEKEQSAVSEELKKLNLGIAGEAGARATAEEEAGLAGFKATEQDLSSQLTSLIAESKQIPLQLQQESERRGRTAGGLRPLQTARLRTNAIQALGVGALLSASQGKIAFAQSQIDRAIEAEFAPKRAKRDALLQNLAIIQADPKTTLEQQNRALAMEAKIKKEEKADLKAEEDKKSIYDLSIQAAQFGANAQVLRDIQNAPNEIEATRIAQEAGVFATTGDQFTLSSGQTRFDEKGEIIAIGTADGDIETKTVGNQIIKINSDGSTEVIFQGADKDDAFTTQQKFSNTMSLRNKFLDESKDFKKVRDSFGRVQASAEDPSAAGDLALIFNYMKILDPGSVVRESEFKTASEAGSFLDRTYGFGLKLKEGQRLAPDQRADFVDRAKRLFQSQVEVQRERQDENQRTASQFGLDPTLGVPDLIPVIPAFRDINDFIDNSSDEQIQAFSDLQQELGIDDNDLIDLINEQLSESPSFSQVDGDTNQADFRIAGGRGNIPQRNQNPGNVKRGGIADKFAVKGNDGKPLTDDQGHLVFPSSEAGFEGLKADVKAKISGRSRVVKEKNPTIAQVGKAFAEDPNWAKGVARLIGVDVNTKAQDVDFDKLINAIATQEGFFA